MSFICVMCGNPIEINIDTPCRYCGHKNSRRSGGKKFIPVNLEVGLPTIEIAREKMRNALADGKSNGCQVIKFIHGYGSSGKGGVMRPAIRASLVKLARSGEIKKAVFGELVGSNGQELRELMRTIPKLKNDRDTRIPNEGITYVVL